MKFSLGLCCCGRVFAFWHGLFAAVPDGGGTAESLATAEKAFARESAEKGIRTAFLDALSDDGVVFDPGSGTQMEKRSGRRKRISRRSSIGSRFWPWPRAVATSGYTTGPWNYRKSPNEKPAAFGEFVSIWRREAGTGNCSATLALTTLRLRRQRQS